MERFYSDIIRTKHGDVEVSAYALGHTSTAISTKVLSGDPVMGTPIWTVIDTIDPDGVSDVTRFTEFRSAMICILKARRDLRESTLARLSTAELYDLVVQLRAGDGDDPVTILRVGMIVD